MFTDPKNVAGYVNVDIDVKELKKDKQLPPKPTYKQIQAYVLEPRLSNCVRIRADGGASLHLNIFFASFPVL